MPIYHAAWIVPISTPPVRNGWVQTRDGRVVACGGPASLPAGEAVTELGHAAVLPALANAHTHLELSWLRGRVAPAANFVDWVGAMMRVRLGANDASDDVAHRTAMKGALAEMRASGTGLVGDVSNSLLGVDLLVANVVAGVVFHELIGFNTARPQAVVASAVERARNLPVPAGWRMALAPHAPYSVSPALFGAIREAVGDGPTAVHVAEARDEVEFVVAGEGRWRRVLTEMGAWNDSWVAPGCSPVEYLDRLGFWREGTLAVHAVQATPADLDRLRTRGATVVTCPRSNAFVGAGAPPVSAFYASGVRVAVGTDSLTSVQDLNLFSDMAALHQLAPEVPPRKILGSATLEGARALGLGDDFGSIDAGKRAAMLAVDVPPGDIDVEHYLVGGIFPSQVRWVENGTPC